MAPGAGAALPECPPGTSANPYCTPGLTLLSHSVRATQNREVKVTVRCAKNGPRCKGRLLLVRRGAGSSAVASAGGTVGSSKYSVAPGKKANITVRLNGQGRRALERKGKLRVSVLTLISGDRTKIGNLLIRGKKRKKPKHVTGVRGKPGFTG